MPSLESTLPVEFVDKMKNLLGDEWNDFLTSYSENNFHALRFNNLKKGMTLEEIADLSSIVGVDHMHPVSWAKYGYYYDETSQPGRHPFHEMGLYYIQEPSAMSAAALLAPKPGERVLDLCAAPGGKSTQLASYMNQEGLLVSNEINPARCKILSQNIERLGLSNVLVTNEDSSTLALHFPSFFHKILVDAPCSGEGMFRKNPEACKEWSPDNVKLCASRQLEILEEAAKMLLPNGTLVYSTCTFAKEENEETIYRFLCQHPEFSLVHKDVPEFSEGHPEWISHEYISDSVPIDLIKDTYRLWPNHLDGEGHFAAILFKGSKEDYERYNSDSNSSSDIDSSELIDPSSTMNLEMNSTLPLDERIQSSTACSTLECPSYLESQISMSDSKANDKKGKKSKTSKTSKAPSLSKEQAQLLAEFYDSTLTEEAKTFLTSGKLSLFGDNLYRLPDASLSLDGLKILRPGLQIGTFKKNRFEPSHALALFLSQALVSNSINLDINDSEVNVYYRGESLNIEAKNGWCLVCINHFSAGWVKASNNILKNHYPKGLRYSF